MGPHPAVALVRSAVRAALASPVINSNFSSPGQRFSAVDHPARVLVACSGGADSLALAAALAFEAPRAGVTAGLVTVDHGLQSGSAEQAARVAALGYEFGFDPVLTLPVDVVRGAGPEAAARTARYAALSAAATAWDAEVLLGHTLDDQAETVLLGLGRGSGPRSIAGMPAYAPPYRRPLLGVRRATTVEACAALGLEPWDDPHNADPAYRRVRIRTEVMPLLENVLGGGVAEALARTASLVRDDLDAVDQQTTAVEIRPERSVDQLAELPRAVRTRALKRWAEDAGATALTYEHVAALDALITDWHGQGPIDLPGGVSVRRASGRLDATKTAPDGRL